MSTIGKTNFPPGGIDTSDATVVASDMKVGVTAYGAAGTKITGTMTVHAVDQTASSITNSTTTLKFLAPAGFYDGTKYVNFTDADFAAGNIRVGYNIFGIDGTYTSDATATAGQILATVTAYVNGAKITGTMTNQGALNYTAGTTNQSIAAGYHNGSGVVYGDADLIAANIKSGINIFGVVGTYMGGGTNPMVSSLSSTVISQSFSGSGVLFCTYSSNALCFISIWFSTSFVTNSSGVITYIDGVSLYDVSHPLNVRLWGQGIFTYSLRALRYYANKGMSVSGPGVAYVIDGNSVSGGNKMLSIPYNSTFTTDGVTGVATLDGVSYNGFYGIGYSN